MSKYVDKDSEINEIGIHFKVDDTDFFSKTVEELVKKINSDEEKYKKNLKIITLSKLCTI